MDIINMSPQSSKLFNTTE